MTPTPQPIRRLDQAVVNRIAAGEIIHRAANALKELIENSLDAGATNIQILIKEGGLKLLQIQDNGHGIQQEDLPIVCERFTTSKLKTFDDLTSIQTYGFRGEALASISHIAHVTITSRTTASNCAYRAKYSDGHLVPIKPGAASEPRPCAGNVGTQITVEDLFYNVPFRRNAFKNTSEEYNRILDIVNRYSIHNTGVSFTCKKLGTATADLHTATSASTVNVIGQIYGSQVSTHLVKLECQDNSLQFKVKGYVSNANYSVKKTTFILFINHRLVDNNALRRGVETVYGTMLPKGAHPFVYLDLALAPENVDVNVHPTKREVHFLNEDQIVAALIEQLQAILASTTESRNFEVQTILTQPSLPNTTHVYFNAETPKQSPTASRVYEHKMVRTDNRSRVLKDFLCTTPAKSPQTRLTDVTTPLAQPRPPRDKPASPSPVLPNSNTSGLAGGGATIAIGTPPRSIVSPTKSMAPPAVSSPREHQGANTSAMMTNARPRVEVRLNSIRELREEVRADGDPVSTAILTGHTFVGLVDYERALIQHDTKLYLFHHLMAMEEMLYQRFLLQFCNFGRIDLEPPVDLTQMLLMALDSRPESIPAGAPAQSPEAMVQEGAQLLIDRRAMLDEYFYMTVDAQGQLTTLPLVIAGYTPNLVKLPVFLHRLVTEVNWHEEKACLAGICRELAKLYAPVPPLPPELLVMDEYSQPSQTADSDGPWATAWESAAMQTYKDAVQHLLFPGFKSHFYAPSVLADHQCLMQLADLPDLYKVFERC
ncbi:DNA mismatch repair protein [Dimargaris verticillata]|uniref:DNA mismatch repair protein n=1 Tax=Dimargaris verticillata TaxID=2761393 RepID=A0A9W8EAJ0_9FUNG|nr:DNA mismatch repair protein [Dimargaris verticillata]